MMTKQARGNASSPSPLLLLAAILLLGAVSSASAYMIYRVGDEEGWTASSPEVDYAKWASQKVFAVGDMLVFAYSASNHTVLQTSNQDAFDSCNTAVDDAKIWSADGYSASNVLLTTPGRTYFLCTAGEGNHCRAGMKFGIDVAGAAPAAGSDGLGAPVGSPPNPDPSTSWNSQSPIAPFDTPAPEGSIWSPGITSPGGTPGITSPGGTPGITTTSSSSTTVNPLYSAATRSEIEITATTMMVFAGALLL